MPHVPDRLRCAFEAFVFGFGAIICLLPLLGLTIFGSYIVTHTSPMAYAILFYGFMGIAFTRLAWPFMQWYRAGGHKVFVEALKLRKPAPPALPRIPLRDEILPWLARTFVQFASVAGYILRGLPRTLQDAFTAASPDGRRRLAMLASVAAFVVLTWLMGHVLDEPPGFTNSFTASSLMVSCIGGIFIFTCWNLFDPRTQPTQPQRVLSSIYACGLGLWGASVVRSHLPPSVITDFVSAAVWILLVPTMLAFVYQCATRGFKALLLHLNSLMDNPS